MYEIDPISAVRPAADQRKRKWGRIDITPEGVRHLDKLLPRVRAAAIEAILGGIADNPQRAGSR